MLRSLVWGLTVNRQRLCCEARGGTVDKHLLKGSGLVFHGLRKTAVITLLEVGYTDAEVASITVQSRRMIVHYARKVSQQKLARAAMGKWQGEHPYIIEPCVAISQNLGLNV